MFWNKKRSAAGNEAVSYHLPSTPILGKKKYMETLNMIKWIKHRKDNEIDRLTK
jgi:hypothetical protein